MFDHPHAWDENVRFVTRGTSDGNSATTTAHLLLKLLSRRPEAACKTEDTGETVLNDPSVEQAERSVYEAVAAAVGQRINEQMLDR